MWSVPDQGLTRPVYLNNPLSAFFMLLGVPMDQTMLE